MEGSWTCRSTPLPPYRYSPILSTSETSTFFPQLMEYAPGSDQPSGTSSSGYGYGLHTDCSDFFGEHALAERSHTLLVYLTTVTQGGETVFPHLGSQEVTVEPVAGDMIIFANLHEDGRCSPNSAHEAAAVAKGEKIVLQKWFCTEHKGAANQHGRCHGSRSGAGPATAITCEGASCREFRT